MLERLRNLISPAAVPPVAKPKRRSVPVCEQRAALLAGKHITYTLKRSSKRRSIGLRIDDRGLTVSMPLRATESWLDSALQNKALWVVEKLDSWQSRKPQAIQWRDGAVIPFKGEALKLCLSTSLLGVPVQQQGKELHVRADDEARIAQRVAGWYRQQAITLFAERVAHYAPLLNVAPGALKLSSAKTRWGSCTSRGTVRLNEQLIRLPLRLIDYVVVHELAHLREMNHSPAFWAVVSSACPDYAKLRRELKATALT